MTRPSDKNQTMLREILLAGPVRAPIGSFFGALAQVSAPTWGSAVGS